MYFDEQVYILFETRREISIAPKKEKMTVRRELSKTQTQRQRSSNDEGQASTTWTWLHWEYVKNGFHLFLSIAFTVSFTFVSHFKLLASKIDAFPFLACSHRYWISKSANDPFITSLLIYEENVEHWKMRAHLETQMQNNHLITITSHLWAVDIRCLLLSVQNSIPSIVRLYVSCTGILIKFVNDRNKWSYHFSNHFYAGYSIRIESVTAIA